MKRETITVNKVFMAVFAIAGISCLVLAFWKGMLHHMLLAGVCAIMYLALKGETSQLENE